MGRAVSQGKERRDPINSSGQALLTSHEKGQGDFRTHSFIPSIMSVEATLSQACTWG